MDVISRGSLIQESVNIMKKKIPMDIKKNHSRLGHLNFIVTNNTAEIYDIKLKVIERKYENCDPTNIKI